MLDAPGRWLRRQTIAPLVFGVIAAGTLVVFDSIPECEAGVRRLCEGNDDLRSATLVLLGLLGLCVLGTVFCLVSNARRRSGEREALSSWPRVPAIVHRAEGTFVGGGHSGSRRELAAYHVWYEVRPPGEAPFIVETKEQKQKGVAGVLGEGDDAVVAVSPDRTKVLTIRYPASFNLARIQDRFALAAQGVLSLAAITGNDPTGNRTHSLEERLLTYAVYPNGAQPFSLQRAVHGATPEQYPVGMQLVLAFDPAAPTTRFYSWPLHGNEYTPGDRPPQVDAFVATLR